MPRLPVLTEHELNEQQRVLWDRIVNGPRRSGSGSAGLVDDSGGLVGPFNAWLHSPTLGLAAADLGEAVRFQSSLDPRLLELAIVVVSCHWRCDFELWAHRPRAVDAGVPVIVIDALVAGEDPVLDDPADALIVTATRELLRTGRLADETSMRRSGCSDRSGSSTS